MLLVARCFLVACFSTVVALPNGCCASVRRLVALIVRTSFPLWRTTVVAQRLRAVACRHGPSPSTQAMSCVVEARPGLKRGRTGTAGAIAPRATRGSVARDLHRPRFTRTITVVSARTVPAARRSGTTIATGEVTLRGSGAALPHDTSTGLHLVARTHLHRSGERETATARDHSRPKRSADSVFEIAGAITG